MLNYKMCLRLIFLDLHLKYYENKYYFYSIENLGELYL